MAPTGPSLLNQEWSEVGMLMLRSRSWAIIHEDTCWRERWGAIYLVSEHFLGSGRGCAVNCAPLGTAKVMLF